MGKQDKRDRFVQEYLIDLNATQAYLRTNPGVKETTARTEASRLLADPNIQIAIQNAKATRSQRTAIRADRVLRELARIAFSDQRHFANWDAGGVSLKSSEELTTAQARALAEISERSTPGGTTLRIKLHDKVKALELLGRHLSLFERPEGTMRDGQPLSFVDLVKKAQEAKKKKD